MLEDVQRHAIGESPDDRRIVACRCRHQLPIAGKRNHVNVFVMAIQCDELVRMGLMGGRGKYKCDGSCSWTVPAVFASVQVSRWRGGFDFIGV